MPLITTFRVALKSLQVNRMRSLLAMLGIVIGIAAVISMLAIGAGAQSRIMSNISSMGTNLLTVRPGQFRNRGVFSGSFQSLTENDAKAILQEVSSIESVSPVTRNSAQLKYFDMNTNTRAYGTASTWPSIRNYTTEYGRFFNDAEAEGNAKVVILGSQTAESLGLTGDSIGENIKLKGIMFKLIGILKEKGGAGFDSPDDLAVIPYTTAIGIVFGSDHIDEVAIKVADGEDVNKAQAEIEALMRKRHDIASPQDDDFSVFNQAEIIQAASSATGTFTILLGTIASISLIVGGIGIMNIMLVTVTERTREIGIRKAIGAKEKDILLQFLLEAIIMCLTGALIGVALGVGAAKIIGKTSDFVTTVQLSSVVVSLIFAITVGVFFGFYPARRAASLDPVDALSYE